MTLTPSDAGWEEVYGPDYPLSDVPILANTLCRVRRDLGGIAPNLIVDVWDPGSGLWAQQATLSFQRTVSATRNLDRLLSVSVLEWTPDRAAIQMVCGASADGSARARIVITLQRGWTGPQIEIYPAQTGAGAATGAGIVLTAAAAVTASGPTGNKGTLAYGGAYAAAVAIMQPSVTITASGSTGTIAAASSGYLLARLAFPASGSLAAEATQLAGEVLYDQRVDTRRLARG